MTLSGQGQAQVPAYRVVGSWYEVKHSGGAVSLSSGVEASIGGGCGRRGPDACHHIGYRRGAVHSINLQRAPGVASDCLSHTTDSRVLDLFTVLLMP